MSEHGYTQPLDVPELLSTKLASPRPHPALVPRGRLFERLDEGLEHRLTLLSALLYVAYHYLTTKLLVNVPLVSELRFSVYLPLYLGAIAAGGVVVGFFGSLLSVRRFLRA